MFQLYFLVPEFTHTGCHVDPRSVQVSPATKFKLTTGVCFCVGGSLCANVCLCVWVFQCVPVFCLLGLFVCVDVPFQQQQNDLHFFFVFPQKSSLSIRVSKS